MKRPASTAGPAAKKAKGPSVTAQCKEVARALAGAEAYPPQVLAMLSENLAACLSEPKEDRHAFQARVAEMAGEVLTSIKAGIEGKISAAKEKLEKADAEKATREAAVEETKAKAVQGSEALDSAKKEVQAAVAEMKAANEALKKAEQEQKAGDAELAGNESKKAKLESTIETIFVPCKEGALQPALITKGVQELTKLGKDWGFDTALITSLPSALSKEPASRGSFDSVVVKQVEEELQNRLETLKKSLAEAAPAREERAGQVSAKSAALEAAKLKDQSLVAAVKAAQEASKEAEAAMKAAARALKAFGPEMKSTGAELAEAEESLASIEGVLATFRGLLDRSKEVPPEPAAEAAEAAAAAEPAASS